MFTLIYGCDEWQDSEDFESLEDCEDVFENVPKVMGLYPVEFAYVIDENENTIKIFDF